MKYIDVLNSKLSKKGIINDYLSVSDNKLHYKGVDLLGLAKEYGSPLETGYVDIITERVNKLKKCFDNSARTFCYSGRYLYSYACKANYYSEVISTALNSVDAIETTSSYELDIVEYLNKVGLMNRDTLVICNGFKQGEYLEKIFKLREKGQNIHPVLENENELEAFLDRKDLHFDVGMRLNLDHNLLKHKSSYKNKSTGADSRFGFTFKDMQSGAKKIAISHNLELKTFHFHPGGTIGKIDVYKRLVEYVYRNYYCQLKKDNPKLENFDIGGGVPTQYSLDFKFDYQLYSDALVELVVRVSKEEGIKEANIIGENGRYTVNDHGFIIYKILMSKKIKDERAFWYFINGSFMNSLPDSWAKKQKFIILPLNGYDQDAVKVKLGGATNDQDDTYFKQEDKGYLYMPQMKDGEDLYIGVFGVGAYQLMIAGSGGVHHCLLPEGNELIIYSDKAGKKKFDAITKLQSSRQVLDILGYQKEHDLTRYRVSR